MPRSTRITIVTRFGRALAVAAAALVAGCATASAPAPAATPRAEAPAADQDHAPPAPPAPTVTSGTAPRTIARSELARVLDRSPGYFLQHVVTEPEVHDGRFHGWRVVSFFPGDARFAGVDLQAGDVVTRINGRPIEQPDQFMSVWDALRTDPELVVEVERNGAPRSLRWTIADK